MGARAIYVETRLQVPMEDIWDATQVPEQHVRWDVRFSSITLLPLVPGEPQRFTYATKIAPGVAAVAGTGESLTDRGNHRDDTRWSGLKFSSSDRRSIIRSGAGYWRYIPTDDGVRFLTRYDYRTRWGLPGRVIDRWLFRPLFGWATAWSFDRLRLWLEDGAPPERSRDLSIIHAVATLGLAAIWIYQGMVPKLWKTDAGEVAQWTSQFGLAKDTARLAVRASGAFEVALGVATAARSSRRWPFAVSLLLMPILSVASFVADRSQYLQAFNPASLNTAVAALAIVAIASHSGRPSASRTLRQAPDTQPEVSQS